jgi:SAM-dependent methyltransferase
VSQEYYNQVAAAFDRAAASYQDVYAGNPIMAWLTEDSFAHVCRVFPPGARLLEIGCGTGAMAVRVARAGREVVATDISPDMVEQGRKMAANQAGITWVVSAAGELVARVAGPFDGAYSNFGPLNCEPDLARSCGSAGGPWRCLRLFGDEPLGAWEIGWELAGCILGNVRRLRRAGCPHVSVGPRCRWHVPGRYFSPSEFARNSTGCSAAGDRLPSGDHLTWRTVPGSATTGGVERRVRVGSSAGWATIPRHPAPHGETAAVDL